MGYRAGILELKDAIAGLERLPKSKQFVTSKFFGSAYVGGEGCVAAETVISGVPVADWRGGWVLDRYTSQGFLKGKAHLYRVSTQSGKQVVVTAEHRFLTPVGWCPLSSLHAGALIAADDSENDGLAKGKSSNFQGPNWYGLHPHDEVLHPFQAAFLHKSRQLHMPDGDESAFGFYVRLSIENSFSRLGQSTSCVCRAARALVARLLHSAPLGNQRESPSVVHPLDTASLSPHKAFLSRVDAPASSISTGGSSTFRHYVAYPYIDSFWDEIQDISFVKYGDFYDLTVPALKHYSAHGLWHHNSSKTASLVCSAICNAIIDPGGKSLVGRLNMPALESTTMNDFLAMVPENMGEWKEQPKTWTFANGHQVIFRHLDITDPKVQGHIKSENLTAAYVDEASEVDEKVVLLLIGRLRRAGSQRRILRLSSNPAGHDYQWRLFFDPARKTEWKQLFEGINSSSMDNIFLPEDYISIRKAVYPADWAERFIYGHFTDFTDLIYKEFTEASHVWDDTQKWAVFGDRSTPPLDWPVYAGVDVGGGEEGDPWAIPFAALSPDGNLYEFAEIYGSDLRLAPIAEQWHMIMEGRTLEGMAYDYAQRAAAIELEEYGIPGQAANKEVKPGLFKCAQYFHIDPRLKHPFNGAIAGSPRYFLAKSCVNGIREISGYKWAKDRSGEAKNEPSHENSHSNDGRRYIVHTFRPLPAELPKPEKWMQPDVPLMSRMYWQKKKEQDEKAERARGLQKSSLLFHRKRPSFGPRKVAG